MCHNTFKLCHTAIVRYGFVNLMPKAIFVGQLTYLELGFLLWLFIGIANKEMNN